MKAFSSLAMQKSLEANLTHTSNLKVVGVRFIKIIILIFFYY